MKRILIIEYMRYYLEEPRDSIKSATLLALRDILEVRDEKAPETNDLTVNESVRLYTILIKGKQEEYHDENVNNITYQIISDCGYRYLLIEMIYQCDASLWNVALYEKLLSLNMYEASMFTRLYQSLLPHLQNANAMRMLLNALSHLAYIDEKEREQPKKIATEAEWRDFINACVIADCKRIIGRENLQLMPKSLVTRDNLQRLVNIYRHYYKGVPSFWSRERYGDYIKASESVHVNFNALRKDILQGLLVLPASLQTQSMFENICSSPMTMKRELFNGFSKLPKSMQSASILNVLLVTKNSSLAIKACLSLQLALQTESTLTFMLKHFAAAEFPYKMLQAVSLWPDLPVNFKTDSFLQDLIVKPDVSELIQSWRHLPSVLQTEANLKTYFLKFSEENMFFSVIDVFSRLNPAIQTQTNLDSFINSLSEDFYKRWDNQLTLDRMQYGIFDQALFQSFVLALENKERGYLQVMRGILSSIPKEMWIKKNLSVLLPDEKHENSANLKVLILEKDIFSNIQYQQKNFDRIIELVPEILVYLSSDEALSLITMYNTTDARLEDQKSLDTFLELVQLYSHKLAEPEAYQDAIGEEKESLDLEYTRTARDFDCKNKFLLNRYQALAYLMEKFPRSMQYNPAIRRTVLHDANHIIAYKHSEEAERINTLVASIPRNFHSRAIDNRLLTIFTTASVATRIRLVDAFQDLVTGILNQHAMGIQPELETINFSQSTHAVSVHKTISESAERLMEVYGDIIRDEDDLDEKLGELVSWFDSSLEEKVQVEHEKSAKAVLAINRLSHKEYVFVDPKSGVSTRQLLALVWIGIHDKQKCTSDIKDAYNKMVSSLYDIQRGYNLDDKFVEKDAKAEDRIICTAGTFNKLMEILWCIHPDVNIVIVTMELASLKLHKVTEELIAEHFRAKKEACHSPDDEARFLEEVRALREEGAEVIWDVIKIKLSEVMYDEFGSLFESVDDAEFYELIDSGKWVDLSKLTWEKWLGPDVKASEIQATLFVHAKLEEKNEQKSLLPSVNIYHRK